MTDAPETIFARADSRDGWLHGHAFGGPSYLYDWNFKYDVNGATYIRYDLFESMQSENRRLRENLTIDKLAQIIRTVDGENRLGAAALAEAILAEMEK